MSKPEDRQPGDTPETDAFRRLERAVDGALARVETLKGDLRAAHARNRELEALLKRFTGGQEDAADLMGRVQRLEDENGVLTERLRKGRDGVQRLLARIRFLEEQG